MTDRWGLAEPGATLTPAHFSKRLFGLLEPIRESLHPEARGSHPPEVKKVGGVTAAGKRQVRKR